jgi:hypothetical protein
LIIYALIDFLQPGTTINTTVVQRRENIFFLPAFKRGYGSKHQQ